MNYVFHLNENILICSDIRLHFDYFDKVRSSGFPYKYYSILNGILETRRPH